MATVVEAATIRVSIHPLLNHPISSPSVALPAVGAIIGRTEHPISAHGSKAVLRRSCTSHAAPHEGASRPARASSSKTFYARYMQVSNFAGRTSLMLCVHRRQIIISTTLPLDRRCTITTTPTVSISLVRIAMSRVTRTPKLPTDLASRLAWRPSRCTHTCTACLGLILPPPSIRSRAINDPTTPSPRVRTAGAT